MEELENFDYTLASKVEINDGCIKCIWVENADKIGFDSDGELVFSLGYGAVIEFQNGKKMLITNSEWGSIIYN